MDNYGGSADQLVIMQIVSLEKIELELKLNFAFVSFPYKLNCLGYV